MDSLTENFSKLDAGADEGPTQDRCPVKIKSPSRSLIETQKIPRTLTEANLALLESKRYTDVTFIVGLTRYPCHKLILIARSSEFTKLFGPSEHGGKELKEYEVPDTAPYTFELFLKFMYSDRFTGVSTLHAIDLLYLARKFKVELLEEFCVMHVVENINLPDAPNVFAAAEATQSTELRDFALDTMAKEFEAVLSSTEFIYLAHGMQTKILKLLLARDDLPGSEMDILNCVVRWGKRNISGEDDKNERLKNKLAAVLPSIRFLTMTISEFANSVVPINVLNQDIVLNILTYLGATGLVRKEYEKKLKDLTYSTTPRRPTVRTGSVTSSILFYQATTASSEPRTRVLGYLFETLSFRVQIKPLTPTKVKGRFLLTRIFLKLPEGLNTQAEVPSTEQTRNVEINIKIQQLGGLTTEKPLVLKACWGDVASKMVRLKIYPAFELHGGFDYCIEVQGPWTPTEYACSPCGVLKSFVWLRSSESVVKLCDIQRNALPCMVQDLGVGIIRGLELKSQPEEYIFDTTAVSKAVGFQFDLTRTLFGGTSSYLRPPTFPTPFSFGLAATTSTSIVVSTAATTTSSSPTSNPPMLGLPPRTSPLFGLSASSTPLFDISTPKATSTFGSKTCTTTSIFGSSAKTATSVFGGSSTSTTASIFGESSASSTTAPTLAVSPASVPAPTFGETSASTKTEKSPTSSTASIVGGSSASSSASARAPICWLFPASTKTELVGPVASTTTSVESTKNMGNEPKL